MHAVNAVKITLIKKQKKERPIIRPLLSLFRRYRQACGSIIFNERKGDVRVLFCFCFHLGLRLTR
jgi:hypothetical protein